MAGAFTQLFIHAVTAVKFRQAHIAPSWEQEMFSVMGDVLIELGHTPIIINGTDDHVHLLWDHKRTETLSQTMKMVKERSSKWINEHGLTDFIFRWQPGYGAFTVSTDRVPSIKNYIFRQKIHHKIIGVHTEYEKLLLAHGVVDTSEYMFEPFS